MCIAALTGDSMKRLLTTALVCILSASATLAPAAVAQGAPAPASQQVLFQSKAYVAPNVKEQHFEDTINLAPGQEQLPLTMVVQNGPSGKTPFNWFRINIAGYLMASEQNLDASKRRAVVDLTGRMPAGQSQIIIDAAGEPGATLNFTLLTTPVALESVDPVNAMQGQPINLTGSNFSTHEGQNVVLIAGKPAQILASGPRHITARIPADTPAGPATVQVQVNGLATRKVSINVGARIIPVLHSMNYWMAPPGATLTIRGSNFAANPADNVVYFRNVRANVVSASPSTLQVIVPNWSYGPAEMNIPVFVVSAGVRSGNYLPFDIGPKYLGALPPMPGDASSQASSEASSEAGWPLQAGSEASSQAGSEASFQAGSEASFQAGSEAGSEAPGPMIFP